MTDNGDKFAKLMHLATSKGCIVKFLPFQAYNGRLHKNKIGLRQSMKTIEEINYVLAHEIAHAYLHFDKGDTINSDMNALFEEQADRAAKMLLDILNEE